MLFTFINTDGANYLFLNVKLINFIIKESTFFYVNYHIQVEYIEVLLCM